MYNQKQAIVIPLVLSVPKFLSVITGISALCWQTVASNVWFVGAENANDPLCGYSPSIEVLLLRTTWQSNSRNVLLIPKLRGHWLLRDSMCNGGLCCCCTPTLIILLLCSQKKIGAVVLIIGYRQLLCRIKAFTFSDNELAIKLTSILSIIETALL